MQVLWHEAPARCSCAAKREGAHCSKRKGGSRVAVDLVEVRDYRGYFKNCLDFGIFGYELSWWPYRLCDRDEIMVII